MKKVRSSFGSDGELEVVTLISCPNCGKSLMKLPTNYPLYDVQCTGCSFRAQVKTSSSKPSSHLFGAGWIIMEKVLKSGFMIPPLIANFKWKEKGKNKHEILFYPFVPKTSLKQYKLSESHRQPNYEMFIYTGLDKLPHFSLYQQ
jgi:DNA-directed RNA polymerase subunit RPC12/RpoP